MARPLLAVHRETFLLGTVVVLSALAPAVVAGCCSHGAGRPGTSPEGAGPRLAHIGVGATSPGQVLALQPDGQPTLFHLEAPPGFSLSVSEPGEYQIDALGMLDPVLFLYRDEQLLVADDNGGEGNNARVVHFLQAGTYTVIVLERQSRPMTAQVQARLLPPLAPAGALSPGQSATVQVPSGSSARAALRELTLTIAADDTYQLDASAPQGRDAEMVLLRDGQPLGRDSDSGEGLNARIRQPLTQGTYQVRVWDYGLREASITVSVASAAAIAAQPQPALEPVGELTAGQPLEVTTPGGASVIEATRAVTLTVTEPGTYRFDATAPQGLDPEMAVLRENVELQRDSDSGEGLGARILTTLTPGTYQVRVWDYGRRAAIITVTAQRQR